MTLDDRTSVTVITPTFLRPNYIAGLLESLSRQTVLPNEVILVDGSPDDDRRTEEAADSAPSLGYDLRYVRATGGAALQRNVGIDLAKGQFIAFIDDDVRPEPDLLERILEHFADDADGSIGCISGCLTGTTPWISRLRWSLHYRLGILTTRRPGAFDRGSGHPVPRALADPGIGLRPLDVVGTTCAVWRAAVFADGLRFAPFFRTYSYHEDFHLSLVAGRRWGIRDLGTARFDHLKAPHGRPDAATQAAHRVINSRFLFVDVVPARSATQELRFWAFHGVDLIGTAVLAAVRASATRFQSAGGQAKGMWRAYRRWPGRRATVSPLDRSDEI